MAKITLSVPDELYEKLQKYGDRINWSEVFRRAAQAEIEKFERRGELVEGLLDYLSHKLTDTDEARERIRGEEIERFTKKWGEPDHITKNEEPPVYVTLTKNIEIKIDDKRLGKLEVSNSRALAKGVLDRVRRGFGRVDLNSLDEKIRPIAEYLKSKGFIFEQRQLLQEEVMRYVLKMYGSSGRERVRELALEGYSWHGLFASDGEDYVFLGYREVQSN